MQKMAWEKLFGNNESKKFLNNENNSIIQAWWAFKEMFAINIIFCANAVKVCLQGISCKYL
jgi:hypothetical protein